MTPAAKLSLFAVLLAAALVAGLIAGTLVGPIDTGTDGEQHHSAPVVDAP